MSSKMETDAQFTYMQRLVKITCVLYYYTVYIFSIMIGNYLVMQYITPYILK